MNKCCCRIPLRVEDESPIKLKVKDESKVSLAVEEQIIFGGGGDYEDYDGPYTAVPRFVNQVFDTMDKHMVDDFTVEAIEVSRTSNPSGGKTVYIGIT